MFTKGTHLLVVFQNNVNANSLNQSLNFWLVMAGILIIFICLIALFIPNIKTLITKPQEFSGLGVNMRVSILTVFVLMGFVLSLSSFVLQWQNFLTRMEEDKKTISTLEGKIAELQAQETRTRKFDMGILIKPEQLHEVLNPNEWSCMYTLEDSSGKPLEAKPAPLFRVKDGRTFKIVLEGITPETRVQRIELRKGKKLWTVDDIVPFREGTFVADIEEYGEEHQ